MPDALSPEVLRFLEQNIDSVPHLEALLLLWQSLPAEWQPAEVAARIYVPTGRGLAILDDLARRGFAVKSETAAGGFAFNAAGPAAMQVPAVAAAYGNQLVAVSTFIHSKGPASILEFARAFQLKGNPKK